MIALLFSVCIFAEPAAPPVVELRVDPPALKLVGPDSAWTVLVSGKTADGSLVDLTGIATVRSDNPAVAAPGDAGRVRGLTDGAAKLTIEAGGRTATVSVTVQGSAAVRRFHFENDVLPVLSKFGCNSAGCHGKAEGQNGFKLSIFGFDTRADYDALVKETRGRRVFPSAPERSLLISKAVGVLPHGGGVRIQRGSPEYETLLGWIAAGLPFGEPTEPSVELIRVEPRERLLGFRGRQQLRVIARYTDGREADVTGYAKFQSNNDALASVDETGRVSAGESPGDVAIMASYSNAVDVFRAVVPRQGTKVEAAGLVEKNAVDTLVFAKLSKLNISPSGPADDAEYLRRLYLDVIGTLPTPEEARRFLADKRPDRRSMLVDELLQRPEYADLWALHWADLLRVDRQVLGHKRAFAFYSWIRESFAAGKPMDVFARELLTAEGPLDETGPANFHRVVTKPGDAAGSLSQVLLGVRIACAECHHHPFDKWSQTDWYGMQAFFSPVSIRKVGAVEILQALGDPVAKHPRTGETVYAYALGTKMPDANPTGDRRTVLADWLTAPGNPFFARNIANRVWARMMGRGLVEPVDDVRDTNPPSHPELLDALADHLIKSKYDFRALIKLIAGSQTYQLTSKPNATNERDEQNHSRALLRRLDAEVLYDMVLQATGVGEKFAGSPAGRRAIQLWDSKVDHYFLKTFGRPTRVTSCECERNVEPSVSQVLHLLNAPEIHAKLVHEGGTVAKLVRKFSDDALLVEELYLTCYSRFPDAKEKDAAVTFLKADPANRRRAAEDLAWSLMNSLEFVFQH